MEQWRNDVLIHYGVKGMKWGNSKAYYKYDIANRRHKRANENYKKAESSYINYNRSLRRGDGTSKKDFLQWYNNNNQYANEIIDARESAKKKRQKYLYNKLADASYKNAVSNKRLEKAKTNLKSEADRNKKERNKIKVKRTISKIFSKFGIK